jgi:hypothetical protein
MEKYKLIFWISSSSYKVKSIYKSIFSLDFIQLTNVLLTKNNMEKGNGLKFLIFFKAIIHSLQRALIE